MTVGLGVAALPYAGGWLLRLLLGFLSFLVAVVIFTKCANRILPLVKFLTRPLVSIPIIFVMVVSVALILWQPSLSPYYRDLARLSAWMWLGAVMSVIVTVNNNIKSSQEKVGLKRRLGVYALGAALSFLQVVMVVNFLRFDPGFLQLEAMTLVIIGAGVQRVVAMLTSWWPMPEKYPQPRTLLD